MSVLPSMPRWAWLAFVLVVSCRRTEIRSAPEFGAVADARPEALPSLCTTAVATSKRALEDAAHKWSLTPVPKTLVGFCTETPAGAWRIEMPSLADMTDADHFRYAIEARYTVVFESRTGTIARHVPKETLANYGYRSSNDPIVFDFDGDGVPELHHGVTEEGSEGHYANQSELLSFRNGAIVPYAKAASLSFEHLRDVDGDGRPDLIMFAGYDRTLEACGSGFPYDRQDPLFIGHSLANGTFSTSDEQAKAAAKKWCPAPPTKIVTSRDAICLRLRSKSVPKDRAMVESSCTDWSCEAFNAGKPQAPTAAEDCTRRSEFFERTPPFTLP